jgi:hypothetical protein
MNFIRDGYVLLDWNRALTEFHSSHIMAARILMQRGVWTCRNGGRRCQKATAIARAVERHGLDHLQIYPAEAAPAVPDPARGLFLGLVKLTAREPKAAEASAPAAVDPSSEAKGCRAAFERLLWLAANIGLRSGNLMRLAREYRRTERRAAALEKVLLSEVEDALSVSTSNSIPPTAKS